jgi:hypothetical protein
MPSRVSTHSSILLSHTQLAPGRAKAPESIKGPAQGQNARPRGIPGRNSGILNSGCDAGLGPPQRLRETCVSRGHAAIVKRMNVNGHPNTLIPGAVKQTTTPVRELRDMQRVAFKLILDEKTKASDVAQLMRAHVAAGQHRCELLMRAKPKPVDVTQVRKSKKPKVQDAPFSDPSVS